MRTILNNIIEMACDDLAYEYEGLDYTLQQVVDLLHSQGHSSAVASTDAVILEGQPFPMDATLWREAGHEHSLYKQWWPLPESY